MPAACLGRASLGAAGQTQAEAIQARAQEYQTRLRAGGAAYDQRAGEVRSKYREAERGWGRLQNLPTDVAAAGYAVESTKGLITGGLSGFAQVLWKPAQMISALVVQAGNLAAPYIGGPAAVLLVEALGAATALTVGAWIGWQVFSPWMLSALEATEQDRARKRANIDAWVVAKAQDLGASAAFGAEVNRAMGGEHDLHVAEFYAYYEAEVRRLCDFLGTMEIFIGQNCANEALENAQDRVDDAYKSKLTDLLKSIMVEGAVGRTAQAVMAGGGSPAQPGAAQGGSGIVGAILGIGLALAGWKAGSWLGGRLKAARRTA